jgi:superfamily II DNA helicase RecQ
LRNKEQITLFNPKEEAIDRIIETRVKNVDTDEDAELFSLLRLLRKDLAFKANLPPYIIFSDMSLKQMATNYPQTTEQFSMIYGVGEEKLQKYGPIFIDAIIKYCKPKNIEPIIAKKSKPISSFTTRKKTKKKKYRKYSYFGKY